MEVARVIVAKPMDVTVKCYSPPNPKITTTISNPVIPADEWERVVMKVNKKAVNEEHTVILVPEDIGAYNKQEVNEITAYSIVSNEEILNLFKKG